MTRFGALFWLVLVVVAGFATFKAKYAIQDLEDELAKVRKQTVAEQNEIRVLTAEWTYLNQPERLAELNKRFLSLVPVSAKQLQQRMEDIALRTPAPEDAVAEAVPAKAPEPAVATPVTLAAAHAAAPAPVAPTPAPAPVAAVATAPAAVARAGAPSAHKPQVAVAVAKPAVHVQLAKASPASLEALISRIAEVR